MPLQAQSAQPLWDTYARISSGGSVADFNRDGWQDILFGTGGGGPDRLYINNGDAEVAS